ncbi:hypothetical protein [Komagataeibacter nataicola]|nr:hypothetical protein [Komagataeibacter nataicola]WNM10278.1 hypothetical protein RI056_18435 [Komagataeibacter nataicola]GBR23500.1 hypothetical protein AA0616_2536 [Komagataeibacter nataicola NRIC 0616]
MTNAIDINQKDGEHPEITDAKKVCAQRLFDLDELKTANDILREHMEDNKDRKTAQTLLKERGCYTDEQVRDLCKKKKNSTTGYQFAPAEMRRAETRLELAYQDVKKAIVLHNGPVTAEREGIKITGTFQKNDTYPNGMGTISIKMDHAPNNEMREWLYKNRFEQPVQDDAYSKRMNPILNQGKTGAEKAYSMMATDFTRSYAKGHEVYDIPETLNDLVALQSHGYGEQKPDDDVHDFSGRSI